jgi:hypothetical protein
MRSSKIHFIYRSLLVLLIAALMVALTLTLTALGLGNPGDENGHIPAIDGPSSNIRAMGFDSVDRLVTAGSFSNLNRVARFDGTSWSALGDGVNDDVRSLALDSADNVYVGGDFTLSGATPVTHVAKFDGASWSALGSGANDVVWALVTSGTVVYAGGDFTDAGGVISTTYIAMWDGSSWSALGDGMDGSVRALAMDSSGNLYAGGSFSSASGVISTTGIAMWDGSSWSALGGGMDDGSVQALAVDSKGNLYAGGTFTSIGGMTANRIAMWDGSSWSALGLGFSANTLRALAVDGADYVYACGSIDDAGGDPNIDHIAKWNGLAWSALGSGFNSGSACYAMAYKDGFVFTGGGSLNGGAWGMTPPSNQRLGRWTAADGQDIAGTGDYVLYPPTTTVTDSLPVTITVATQGDLARINIQRFDKSHDNATVPLQTGYYWEILGVNASGGAASGFTVTLTLPAPGFTPNSLDTVCEHTAGGWDCAADSYDSSSITRDGITSFSDWAVADVPVFTNYLPIIMRNQ